MVGVYSEDKAANGGEVWVLVGYCDGVMVHKYA